MLRNVARGILNRVRRILRRDPDAFLKHSNGVIHIGANAGQERDQYASLGLPVIWVEPIPEVFEALRSNISSCPNQKALRYLITDEDGKEYDFHVANNNGASSSILEFARHGEIWPEITYTQTIKLHSVTLPAFLARENVDTGMYDALVMDTQGSELLILRGGVESLQRFRYVKLEVPDFEAYRGCCTVDEMTRFMRSHKFTVKHRHRFAESPAGGAYYDVVYRNKCFRVR